MTEAPRPRPVAVVSASLLAPGGLTVDDLLDGTSAVVSLGEEFPAAVGAPVTEELETPADFPHPIVPRGLLLALEAAHRLELEQGPRYGLVLALSSLYAEPAYLEHQLAHRDEPEAMAAVSAFCGDFPLAYLARSLGAVAPRARIDTACASGSDALAVAHQWLEAGAVEDVLVVAASSMLNPIGVALFRNIRALNEEDDLGASRPFDRRRRGFVMGEGAAACWLSRRQPRRPLGWLCAHGRTMNAEKLTDMPRDTGAMLEACRCALGPVRELAYISAHGTATPTNDPCETRIYKELLGDAAYRVPTSSLKSMTGHCLGASSLIEAIVTLEALRRQKAPPTLNLEEPDPECDLDYVPGSPRPLRGHFALSTAFAFGGHNSALLLARDRP